DVGGTAQLLGALAGMPTPAHLVYVSIVGCDQNPYAYYRAKTRAEELILGSELPATVVRATQFHTLVASIARMSTLGRVRLDLDMAAQPVDAGWFARELVDHALGTPPDGGVRAGAPPGPDAPPWDGPAHACPNETPPPARAVRSPPVGRTLRAFAEGANLPGPDARIGGIGFAEWAAEHPGPSREGTLSPRRQQHR